MKEEEKSGSPDTPEGLSAEGGVVNSTSVYFGDGHGHCPSPQCAKKRVSSTVRSIIGALERFRTSKPPDLLTIGQGHRVGI